MRKLAVFVVLIFLGAVGIQAANTDAQTVLNAAAEAMGVKNMKTIQYSGTGWKGAVGQNFAPEQDWPRTKLVYTRSIDFDAKSSKEDFVETQYTDELHGANWYIRNYIDGERRQTALVNGNYAWNLQGNTAVPQPALAEVRQLEIWLTPWGFLKAAMESGNAVVIPRREYGGEKVTIVSFTALGKYRVNGTIDENNLVIRVQTWLANPVVGDMYYETIFSNYKDLGGIKFPTRFHQHNDHDDNNGLPNPSGGDHAFGLEAITDVKVNEKLSPLTIPNEVRNATIPPVRVDVQNLADGVWLMGGGSHNSLAVEFKDYVAVIEAPISEERSLAVIAEVYKLIPNKPIRYLINTHHHWDHIGGLRTYVHEGATIITYEGNKKYYQELFQEKQWHLKPDRLSLYPPEEVAEGFTIDTLKDKYILSDGIRNLELYTIQGLDHAAGMVVAYFPKEKILVEADMYTPPAPGAAAPKPNASNKALAKNLQRLKLDISTIVPIHGRVAKLDEFVQFVGQ